MSALRPELERARWYHGKGRELTSLDLVDRFVVPGVEGGLLAIVAAGYGDGSVAEYAVAGRIQTDGVVREAEPDDPVWSWLARLAAEGGSLEGEHGTVEGWRVGRFEHGGPWRGPRPLGADQSNTSVVVDERVVIKLYRLLRSGVHPEQELLAGLTRIGSSRAPALIGTIDYRRGATVTALATAYEYVEGTPAGWEPAIAALTAALDGTGAELDRLAMQTAELGRCAGELHRDLLAAFGGEIAAPPFARAEGERAVADLGEAIEATRALAPELARLGPRARAELLGHDRLEGTRLHRIHGDLHVAQVLRTPTGAVAIDFEGDPMLPTGARRLPASPLKDVASLLLSLDHVAAAAARRRGFGSATAAAFAWSAQAREAVLAGYCACASPGTPSDPQLLQALELAKEWREALYAARVLPEWLYAPRLVLERLLA